jgi:hypothetical protein
MWQRALAKNLGSSRSCAYLQDHDDMGIFSSSVKEDTQTKYLTNSLPALGSYFAGLKFLEKLILWAASAPRHF